MAKHKATVEEYSDKVSLLETKVQEHKEQTDLIAEKVNKDCIKRKELDNLLRERRASAASDGITDLDFTSGRGLSLEMILTGQAKYNAAFQMASQPSMVFRSEVKRYMQFVTMFRMTFDKVIADPGSLVNLLTKHVAGPAKEAIMPCVYSENGVNRYEEAMTILRERYGSQNSVINAHKKILLGVRKSPIQSLTLNGYLMK